jgi:TPR repeat protein
MFLRGAGCLVDEAKAVAWYRRAAEQGHVTAQANLAKRYLRGEGVAPDLAEAFRWFHAASQQGDIASMWELGTMYRHGRGVERNLVLAADLHLTVAKAGVVAGEVSLGDYLDELQGLALSGDSTASRLLCEMHNLGLGVEESPALTWTWIKWAKAQCKPSNDPDDAAEIEEAHDFYEQWLSEEARADGERVLAALLRPFPQALRARPLPRVRFKRRRRSGSGGERESA